jgi:hypothetical protein
VNALRPEDLLSLPIVDLVECPWEAFFPLFQEDNVFEESHLEALDHALLLRVIRLRRQDPDVAALEWAITSLRQLVPVHLIERLNARSKPWAARITALADLLDQLLQIEQQFQALIRLPIPSIPSFYRYLGLQGQTHVPR